MSLNRWSEQDNARLLDMWSQGYEVKEIARDLGREPKGVSSRIDYLRKTGRPVPRRMRRGGSYRAVQTRSCHPLVKFIYRELERQRATVPAVAARAGVSEYTIRTWARLYNPRLEPLTAVLGALGYELTVKARP